MWWAAASLGLQAVGALAKYQGQRQSADLEREALAEQLRRVTAANARTMSSATAAAAGSGVELSSPSIQNYLTTLQTEMAREADWMRKAGRAGAAGKDRAANLGLLGDIGGALSGYAKANNYWMGES